MMSLTCGGEDQYKAERLGHKISSGSLLSRLVFFLDLVIRYRVRS